MTRLKNNVGFTLVELMITVALFAVISVAGFILFNEGQIISSVAIARIDLQNNVRYISQRLVSELQESGEDLNDVMQVTILDNAGSFGTDILRFSVPICPCGVLPIDQAGEVKFWGAPLVWGQSGCSNNYSGLVDICHVVGPPVDMQVNANQVMAHLAHDDYIGDCIDCSPTAYTNRTIEYMVDGNNRMLRRVLDQTSAVINSVVMAQYVEDFQAVFGAGEDTVTVTVQLQKEAAHNRLINQTGSWLVTFLNKD